MIPFESLEAHIWNTEVFSTIQKRVNQSFWWIASVYGEPEWLKGYGRANSHCLAVAPTKSTALIMGGVVRVLIQIQPWCTHSVVLVVRLTE